MDSINLINVVLLGFLNIPFMMAGIILNIAVIISLRRSSQLRKKLCYFMILVLSCFDLAVVTTVQPLQTISIIFLWSTQMEHAGIEMARKYALIFLAAFSMLALLTLNIERYFALTRPFFHQTTITKGKLTLFLGFQILIVVGLRLLYTFYPSMSTIVPDDSIKTFLLLSFLFVLAFLNYKMLVIVKSKREDELRAAPTSSAASGHQEGQKKQKRNLKNISTCSLVVGCSFMCSSPKVILSIWRCTSTYPQDKDILIQIWAGTFLCINSTFNCVIFFWRNSILRREGMKIVKCLWTEQS